MDDKLKKISELIHEINDVLESDIEPQWPPKYDDIVWFIDIYEVRVKQLKYSRSLVPTRHLGFVHPTKKAAERRLLQLKASANTWRPKDGETYWFWSTNNNGPDTYNWRADTFDLASYYIGNVHRTEEEAKVWYKEYKELFDE